MAGMFDEIPFQAWLLIGIAVAAFVPAQYVYHHIASSPSRRDITQPPEDLSWRTNAEFLRSSAVLAALVGLAIFIFTPMAERFASSPSFSPALMVAIGAAALITVVRGLGTGRIEPLLNGFHTAFERALHPKRYWASIAWNAMLGCLLFWIAFQIHADEWSRANAERCALPQNFDNLERELATCAEYIRLRPDDPGGYMDRGLIFLEIGALDEAATDFTEAHRLDPEDASALANRGIVAAWMKERTSAEGDLRAARLIEPENPAVLRGQAILKQDAGDIKGALDDLTASLARDPHNLWAIRTRAELYWELGDHEKSAADDARWLELNKRALPQPSRAPPPEADDPRLR
jgi:tetratricopeptide (TPR) repeat protein